MQDILDFTLYYNRYKKKLFNYTLRMTGNRMATEDILQTTFMRFYLNMGNIRHGVAIEFFGFLRLSGMKSSPGCDQKKDFRRIICRRIFQNSVLKQK
ncbi:MAG: hypothetical protein IPG53_11555 [Ignavibacteriales bacterium]|nr:hypothetical protein [Ignavibacteriales bacterium]